MDKVKIDKLIRSRRRTIALMIAPDATLVIRAPMKASLDYIEKLVWQKRSWIEKKQQFVLKNLHLSKAKKFEHDEEFYFLGKVYKFRIVNNTKIILADFLYFPEKFLLQARTRLINWYKQKAAEVIVERANYYSKITGWEFKKLLITGAERRWGSCSSRGSINFSWKLIMAPMEIIDYVVVHELAHIPEKNHSARFWNKVESVLPDYRIRRKWLKENEARFKI
jgi:predicted metal-dependent hydrolase